MNVKLRALTRDARYIDKKYRGIKSDGITYSYEVCIKYATWQTFDETVA